MPLRGEAMASSMYRPLGLAPHAWPGALITFCGVDGSGKTSLIEGITTACRTAGYTCLKTHTPTRRIRQDPVFRAMVGDPCTTSTPSGSSYDSAGHVNVLGMLLSIMGDLIQHTTDTIIPALRRGEVVLCDRYVFTSQAEIGARSDLHETGPVLAGIAAHVLQPDAAFGLAVSGETSSRRVHARNDRNDMAPPRDFLERQVNAYRAVFEANGVVVIDTEREAAETLASALARLRTIKRLSRLGNQSSADALATGAQVREAWCGVVSRLPTLL